MNSEHDASSAPGHGRRLVVIVGALAVLVAAAAWLLPMLWEGKPAERAPSAEAPRSSVPAPAPAAAVPEPPAPAADAARDKPRPRRKAEAPAPAAAPEPSAPTTGELHIDADVPAAMVFIDRQFIGNTPVTAKNLAPGRHQLNLTADGFDGYSAGIEVAAGPADVMVKFKEVRLDASVDVVHKHGIGSCEGRLVADPQGIRYETSNKDDAFTMKFADVEAFEVDYLKKNLRIKQRGGKQFNFTTKAANADPLFVFHRDVDKVRRQVTGTKK